MSANSITPNQSSTAKTTIESKGVKISGEVTGLPPEKAQEFMKGFVEWGMKALQALPSQFFPSNPQTPTSPTNPQPTTPVVTPPAIEQPSNNSPNKALDSLKQMVSKLGASLKDLTQKVEEMGKKLKDMVAGGQNPAATAPQNPGTPQPSKDPKAALQDMLKDAKKQFGDLNNMAEQIRDKMSEIGNRNTGNSDGDGKKLNREQRQEMRELKKELRKLEAMMDEAQEQFDQIEEMHKQTNAVSPNQQPAQPTGFNLGNILGNVTNVVNTVVNPMSAITNLMPAAVENLPAPSKGI